MLKALLLTALALLPIGMITFMLVESRQERKLLTPEVRSSAPGQFIALQHGQVHYQLDGPDTAELIVFVHGGGVTGMEVWRRNVPYFINKGYRVLAYDLYGRGFSERPSAEHTPELFYSQLTQLLDGLQLSDSFHIVAMSMGAIVALDYASQNPERVKKLVIIDPAATGDFRPNPILTVPIVSDALMTLYWYPRAVENQRKEFVDMALFNSYAKRLEYFMAFKGYKESNYSTWMSMLNQNKLDLIKSIPATDILLIYGDKDPYFNDSKENLYRTRVPSLQVAKISWAGHMPHLEKPVEVNYAIYSFITDGSEVEVSLYQ